MDISAVQDLKDAMRSGGCVALFGVSAEDQSLVDLVALHNSNSVTAVAGDLALLPRLFATALPTQSLDDLIGGSLDTFSMQDHTTLRVPVLKPGMDWSALVSELIDESGDLEVLPDFSRVRYQQKSEGPFSASEVWLGNEANSTLEQVFKMFAFNAMMSGDPRQSCG